VKANRISTATINDKLIRNLLIVYLLMLIIELCRPKMATDFINMDYLLVIILLSMTLSCFFERPYAKYKKRSFRKGLFVEKRTVFYSVLQCLVAGLAVYLRIQKPLWLVLIVIIAVQIILLAVGLQLYNEETKKEIK